MLERFVTNYIARHQNGCNQLLHLIGVPLTFVGSVVLAVRGEWLWAVAAFFGGYVLQFVGHAVEGNDAGEVVLVKKLLGQPYVEFAPRAEKPASPKESKSNG